MNNSIDSKQKNNYIDKHTTYYPSKICSIPKYIKNNNYSCKICLLESHTKNHCDKESIENKKKIIESHQTYIYALNNKNILNKIFYLNKVKNILYEILFNSNSIYKDFYCNICKLYGHIDKLCIGCTICGIPGHTQDKCYACKICLLTSHDTNQCLYNKKLNSLKKEEFNCQKKNISYFTIENFDSLKKKTLYLENTNSEYLLKELLIIDNNLSLPLNK